VQLGNDPAKDYKTEAKENFGPKNVLNENFSKISRGGRKSQYKFNFGTQDGELMKKRNTLAYIGEGGVKTSQSGYNEIKAMG
jgi:hypothetical protein